LQRDLAIEIVTFLVIASIQRQRYIKRLLNLSCVDLQDRPDRVVEAQLYLHRLEPSSFRTYTLVAENSIATAAADIQLIQSASLDCFFPSVV
jgi:hypothetical protein